MDKSVLATVETRKITNEDIENLLRGMDRESIARFDSPEGRKQLVKELVNQELFYLDAKRNELDKEDEFLEEVEKNREALLRQYAVKKALNSATVDEEEAVLFYEENKEQFISPPSISASHILVESEIEAKKIIHEINAGLLFAEAAKKYSMCPSSEKGGDLGEFGKGTMVAEFDEVAFKLDKNEISNPVKTQFGYHIIKVTNKKNESEITFDKIKDSIISHLLNAKQQGLYIKKTNELKKDYTVKFNI